jgi:chromosome segregation ATPase
MDNTTQKILEIVTEIQDGQTEMRKEMSELRKDISDVRRELDTNTRAIAELADQPRSVFGYAKEIDLLMSRVAKLEQHIGLGK